MAHPLAPIIFDVREYHFDTTPLNRSTYVEHMPCGAWVMFRTEEKAEAWAEVHHCNDKETDVQ